MSFTKLSVTIKRDANTSDGAGGMVKGAQTTIWSGSAEFHYYSEFHADKAEYETADELGTLAQTKPHAFFKLPANAQTSPSTFQQGDKVYVAAGDVGQGGTVWQVNKARYYNWTLQLDVKQL